MSFLAKVTQIVASSSKLDLFMDTGIKQFISSEEVKAQRSATAESLDDRAKVLLKKFDKKVDIKQVISPVKGELKEKVIDDVVYTYGNRELSAITPDGLMFIWDVNSFGDRDSYMLFDVQDENGKSV